jgi:hypothetical protein
MVKDIFIAAFIFCVVALCVEGVVTLTKSIRTKDHKLELMNVELGRRQVQKEAIQHGFAHYNQTNGVFEWNK